MHVCVAAGYGIVVATVDYGGVRDPDCVVMATDCGAESGFDGPGYGGLGCDGPGYDGLGFAAIEDFVPGVDLPETMNDAPPDGGESLRRQLRKVGRQEYGELRTGRFHWSRCWGGER